MPRSRDWNWEKPIINFHSERLPRKSSGNAPIYSLIAVSTTSIVFDSLLLGCDSSSSSYPTRRFRSNDLFACTRAVCCLLIASWKWSSVHCIVCHGHVSHTFLNESSSIVNTTNDTTIFTAPPFSDTHCTTTWDSTMLPIANADVLAGSNLDCMVSWWVVATLYWVTTCTSICRRLFLSSWKKWLRCRLRV